MLTVAGSGTWKPLHGWVVEPGERQPSRSMSAGAIFTRHAREALGADGPGEPDRLVRRGVAGRDVGLRAPVVAVAQLQRQVEHHVRQGGHGAVLPERQRALPRLVELQARRVGGADRVRRAARRRPCR